MMQNDDRDTTVGDYFASRLIGGPKNLIAFTCAVDRDAHGKRLIVWVRESVSVFYGADAREVYDDMIVSDMATGPNPFSDPPSMQNGEP